jgi:hypothetical protein
MTTFADVLAEIKNNPTPSFRAADGTANTEFVWLESQAVWLWFDGFNKDAGWCEGLVFLFDSGDGDELGYNQDEGLLGTCFESSPSMWVFEADGFDLDVSETSQIVFLGDPTKPVLREDEIL